MDKWAKACDLAGVKVGFMSSVLGKADGAERTALVALFNGASSLADGGEVESAAEHLKLAAAMVEQRGRVLGALRAAKAVEEALWPIDEEGNGQRALSCDSPHMIVQLGVLRSASKAMVENGFGPQPEGAL